MSNESKQSLADFLTAELYDRIVEEARARNLKVDEVLKEAIKRCEQKKEQQ